MRYLTLLLSATLAGCPQNKPTEQKEPTPLTPTGASLTPPKDPLAAIKDIPADLRRDWLSMDAAILPKVVAALPVQENDTPTSLFARFGSDPTKNTTTDLGFKGARHYAYQTGGYTSCHFALLALNDKILDATLSCRGSEQSWEKVRPLLEPLYQAPLVLSEDKKSYTYHYTSKEGEAALFAAVSAELGAITEVAPPEELAAAYQTLRSESLTLGTHCGAGGSPPKGRAELDSLVKAKHADLLRQVLRGISPEGRVYAIEGLTTLKEKLSAEDEAAIEKLSALPLKLTTCSGCMEQKLTAEQYLHPIEEK